MQNKRHRIGGVIGVVTLGLFSFFVTLSELPLLPESERPIYFAIKMVLAALTIPLGVIIWKYSTSLWANLSVAVAFMFYTLIGQWYRPLYIVSFAQLVFALSFIYTLPKSIFRVFIVIWALALLFVMNLHWAQFEVQMQHQVFSDFVFMIIAVGAIAIIAHTYYTSDRIFRETTLSRLSRMGFNSSRLIHDLKSLTSAPRTYSDLLKSRLGDTLDPVVTESLAALSNDLENLNRVVMELNQLSMVKGQGEYTTFSLQDVISSVNTLLGARLKFIEIENRAACEIYSDKSILNSVFLNLFMNALENFKKNSCDKPKIRIKQVGNQIIFSDNGGGFSKTVIHAVNSQSSASSKVEGGGLGLWMIKDGMEILDGNASFSNVGEGACVTLVFPKKAIMSTAPVLEPILA